MRKAAIIGALLLAALLVYLIAAAPDSPPAGMAEADAAATGSYSDDPPTLAGAIARARPLMTDEPEATSAGTLSLLGWSMRHLQWSDVAVKTDETSYALVQSDVDGQRGRRLCVTGKVVRQNMVKTDSARYLNGVLAGPGGQVFAFLGARSIIPVDDSRPLRFCGVVTGRDSPAPEPGTPSAVVVVGMFDVDDPADALTPR